MNVMKNSSLVNALVLAVLMVGAVSSFATEAKTSKPENATTVSAHPSMAKKTLDKKITPAKKIKPVNINKASKAQLKTIPGISDAEADKIIAGRPYKSKADLSSHGILPGGVYLSIKDWVIVQ